MIPFNIAALTGNEQKYLNEVLNSKSFHGDQVFTRRCEEWLMEYLPATQVLMTASCTQALEIAALLLDLGPDDEVIMPSYTFVSTANAFALRGAQIRFVDINPHTMNIDLECVEAAITPRTKVIVPVHYAGMSCDMNRLMELANERQLFVVEDAAQALCSSWNGQRLGTFGHLSCFSFHDTKNYHCGEGGALVVNDPTLVERAHIIREKGTNRRQFFEGLIDKYTWVDLGTSGLMSELQAAFLLAQLEESSKITERRLALWDLYRRLLSERFHLFQPHDLSKHNAHIFAVFIDARASVLEQLNSMGVSASFHYIPLHSTSIGSSLGTFIGDDRYTTSLSQKVLRMPLYYSLSDSQVIDISNILCDVESVIV